MVMKATQRQAAVPIGRERRPRLKGPFLKFFCQMTPQAIGIA